MLFRPYSLRHFLYLTKGFWIIKISENFIEHLSNGIILVEVQQWFCFSCWLMFLLGNIYWSYGKMILTNDDIVNKSGIQESDKYRPNSGTLQTKTLDMPGTSLWNLFTWRTMCSASGEDEADERVLQIVVSDWRELSRYWGEFPVMFSDMTTLDNYNGQLPSLISFSSGQSLQNKEL